MELTKEMIAKAKEAKTVEELVVLAKENGIELTFEEAEECFTKLHKSGELADEELDNVAGGGCGGANVTCVKCHSSNISITINGHQCKECGYLMR